ncbi:hypothetical protein [Nocardia asteroides]|uniref:hypothetical protein n=1 Tax=Nocardia asteroides TaxID=1824 RepID=UPI001E412A47|nr:hypothetical protein [Nocardia asteroides]UGT62870.1 hypothetical protein LTT61_05900 [Nocardia asteroides]
MSKNLIDILEDLTGVSRESIVAGLAAVGIQESDVKEFSPAQPTVEEALQAAARIRAQYAIAACWHMPNGIYEGTGDDVYLLRHGLDW